MLDQQIRQAVGLLADLFHHSRFDRKEIEREKQVVLEEIRAIRDDPEDLVHELHAKQVLRGPSIGAVDIRGSGHHEAHSTQGYSPISG